MSFQTSMTPIGPMMIIYNGKSSIKRTQREATSIRFDYLPFFSTTSNQNLKPIKKGPGGSGDGLESIDDHETLEELADLGANVDVLGEKEIDELLDAAGAGDNMEDAVVDVKKILLADLEAV